MFHMENHFMLGMVEGSLCVACGDSLHVEYGESLFVGYGVYLVWGVTLCLVWGVTLFGYEESHRVE